MSRPEPYRTWASSSEATRDTCDPPRRLAPVPGPGPAAPPGPPALVERGRGQHGGLELAVALDGQQRPEQRHAADEVVGPVDRVDVPADGRVAGLGAVLLADQAVIREGVRESLADAPFDRRVGLRHEGPVGLGLDDEVAAEVRSRRHVGLVAGGLRDVEPATQLDVGPPPEPGRPFRAVRRVAHDRIRSPVGSHSGSRATSNPIHSPKTSTSPRVPIAAVGGR